MKNKKLIGVLFLILILLASACKKYLDAKPDKALKTPTELKDLQSILDNNFLMNGQYTTWDEASADNYYLLQSTYNRVGERERKAYTWQEISYTYGSGNEWSALYDIVYFTNVVLDNIDKITLDDKNFNDWNNVKGSALLYRAQTFLQTAFLFAQAYDENSANTDYGIVLRKTSDFNVPSVRSTVEETYNQIINDLNKAVQLLPDLPQHVMRPSKSAAYGYLARTYLSMRKYDSAYKYANKCLELKGDLMDYNSLDIDAFFPFTQFNEEVIFEKSIGNYKFSIIGFEYAKIDTAFINTYADNDLRKNMFFLDASIIGDSGILFSGGYNYGNLFTGLATDEFYLTRAECNARLSRKADALSDLNTLMEKRWKAGTFIPFTANSDDELLDLILTERRKELIFRGLRWIDLKRLNKEGANITLKRTIGGQIYTLPPNDKRYALPLPSDIINDRVPQNPT